MIKPGALLMAAVMGAVASGTYFGLDMLPPGLLPPPLGRIPPAPPRALNAEMLVASAAPVTAATPAPTPAAAPAPATSAAAPTEQELAEEPAPKPAAVPKPAAAPAPAPAPVAAAPKAEPAPAPVAAAPAPKAAPTPAPAAAAPAPKAAPAPATEPKAKPAAEPKQETAVTEAAPAPKPEKPKAAKPAAAAPEKTQVASAEPASARASGGAESDQLKQWWPEPSKLPANQLKLMYAGDVQGQSAIALLFSDAPNMESLKLHARVRDADGNDVHGSWEAPKNPRLVVYANLKPGRYTVILDRELADTRGFALGQTLQGAVYIQAH